MSQCDNEIPQITPAKRVSDEIQGVLDGDMSTTKLKSVKVEKN